jgi:WD40 repeat protein
MHAALAHAGGNPALPRKLGRLIAVLLICFVPLPSWTQAGLSDVRIEIVPNIGHSDDVKAIAFSPDGRTIVTGSSDNSLKLWHAATGRELRTLTGHTGYVRAVAFSPDGRTVVSASWDGSLKLWDTVSGRVLHTLKGHEYYINAVAFSPDGRTIVSGASDKSLRVWDVASGRSVRTMRQQGEFAGVTAVAFSPDGRTIVSGDADKILRLWEAASGRLLRTLVGHRAEVHTVAFSPDGRTILSGSFDQTVKLWDAASGQELHSFTLSDKVLEVAFSPDGKSVAASSGYRLTVWHVASRKILQTGKILGDAFAFSPDGRTIASDARHSIRLWDAASGRALTQPTKQGEKVRALAVAPDGHTVAFGDWHAVRLWDAGRPLRDLSNGSEYPYVEAVAYSPDGRRIVSATYEKTLLLWEAASGRLLRTLAGHGGDATAVAFSPDGRMIASGSDDKTLKLWDAETGRELRSISAGDYVKALAFSPDGRTLAGADLKLWDVATGRELRTFKINGVLCVAFSPDGRTIVSGGYGKRVLQDSEKTGLDLWDATTGRRLRALAGHDGSSTRAVAFSPDGRSIVSASDDKTLKLWDVASGRALRTFSGHGGEVTAVAFSPDGRTIISGSEDTTVRYWSLAGEPLATSISTSDGEWLTITPEGFFDASERGAQILSAVRGLEAFSIDQFYQSLYRPDLVREKLAGDPRGLVREAAAKLDLSKAIASGGAPRVAILSPAANTTSGSEEVTVEAEITDQGGGVGRVEWRVNGVTLGVEERGLARVEGAPGGSARPTLTTSRKLSLEPGDNTIEVVAYNARNLIASLPTRVSVKWDGSNPATLPKLHVLAIGVNDYWDSRLRLTNAVPDANAIADALKEAGRSLYREVEVTRVLDANATIDSLDRVLAEMARKVAPRDVFLFFLAGHGKTVDGRYYFLPRDFRYEGEDSIVRKGVDQDRLQAWFARIPARKSILLFDTCESGSLTAERMAQRGIERVTALEKMTRAMGRTVLSASTDDTPALEGYRGHGVFTYALLEGIGAADADSNGLIEVTELAGYVDQRVPDLSYEAFKYRQVPQMKIVGSNFPLAAKTLVLGTEAPSTMAIPSKPTHVVIAPSPVHEAPGADSTTLQQLAPGAQVVLVETVNGWTLIARDGKKLGYVEEKALLRLQ